MNFVVTGTEAIIGARTHGAVQKSRWKGAARIQTHSSSLTKDSIYTLHTLSSYRTSHSMVIHLPRSLKEPFQKPSSRPMKPNEHQNKPKSTRPMSPVLAPCLAPAQLMITCMNRVWKEQVLKGCLKMWCLLWFGIHQTTTCLQIPPLHLTVLRLPHRLPPCLGLPIFPIHFWILPQILASRESALKVPKKPANLSCFLVMATYKGLIFKNYIN